MDLNILKALHVDLEKLLIKNYINVYNDLHLGKIIIDHDKTTIEFNIPKPKIELNSITFSNENWKE